MLLLNIEQNYSMLSYLVKDRTQRKLKDHVQYIHREDKEKFFEYNT